MPSSKLSVTSEEADGFGAYCPSPCGFQGNFWNGPFSFNIPSINLALALFTSSSPPDVWSVLFTFGCMGCFNVNFGYFWQIAGL